MALRRMIELGDTMPSETLLSREKFLEIRNTTVEVLREYGEVIPGEPGRIGKLLGVKPKPYWRATGAISWMGRVADVIMRTSPSVDIMAPDLNNAVIGINMKNNGNSILYLIGKEPSDSLFVEKRNGIITQSKKGTSMLAELDQIFWDQLKEGLEWYRK